MARKIVLLLLIICNVGCDQISKDIVRKKISTDEIIEVYKDNFILTKAENTGAALGLGQNLPPNLKFILLNILPLIVLVSMTFWILNQRKPVNQVAIAFAFIIGGGIGNLIDRFLFGSVTDFFFIKFDFFKTGIFNMADVSVTFGAFLVLTYTLSAKKVSTGID